MSAVDKCFTTDHDDRVVMPPHSLVTDTEDNKYTLTSNRPSASSQAPIKLADNDLETLRAILLGDDYDELITFKENAQNHYKQSESIAKVVSEALAIRSTQDNSVAETLAPTIQKALTRSIASDPKPIADALYPVMGPAIRKSINESLTQMLDTFNQLLEQSFSLKSILWRFDAWRTGRSYAEIILLKTLLYQVEEVFLIHHEDGLLLQHASLESVITQDGDMVSGMLTAIQDFINDSFAVEEGANTGLNTLRLGELTVFIEHGPKAVLAAVIRGKPPESLRQLFASTLEDIHRQHIDDFNQYNGDSSPFDCSQPLLEDCLKVQKQKRKTNLLPLFILLALLASAAVYWGYSKYQQVEQQQQEKLAEIKRSEKEGQQWEKVVRTLRLESGLIVINAEKGQYENEIEVLLDPLARQPSQVVSNLTTEKPIVFITRPYLSLDDAIVLLRAKQTLRLPAEVNLVVENSVLHVSGEASVSWANYLQSDWKQVMGLQQLNIEKLHTYDQNLPVINALKLEIERSKVSFDKNKAELSQIANGHIKTVSRSINKLIRLAKQSNKGLEIRLIGRADHSGTEMFNQQLVLQRTVNVKWALMLLSVPESLFVNALPLSKQTKNERSVRYQVILSDQ